MAVVYRVYANNLAGSPVNFDAPVATVSGLSWATPPLPAGADASFVVRAYDTATGLEGDSADARVRVRLDDAGNDVTAYPAAPVGLTARARAGGTAAVNWAYPPGGGASGFSVYCWPASGPPDYAAEVVAVAAGGGPGRVYAASITGLAAGVGYLVAVRAFNAAGEETNTATAAVTGPAPGPAAVVPVSASATP